MRLTRSADLLRFTPAAAALLLAACAGEKQAATESADAPADQATEAALTDEKKEPSANDFAKLAAENLAAAESYLAENAGKDGVKTTESGLQYLVLEEGAEGGYSPAATDIVDVHYVGTLTDGKEFDSSRARGAAARFPLNRVIPGWTEGVQLMSEGDKFRFFVPPALAYGEQGAGPIPPNSTLIFDVELLKVVSPERNLAAATAFLEQNAKKDGVKTTESGLQYEVLVEGPADGKTPNETSKVKVHYVGTLVDGVEFDSSIARGQPTEFPVNAVIEGWTEGLQLMSVGDKFRFFIHPDLAYGENPRPGGAIGPNDALIFEVELLDVN